MSSKDVGIVDAVAQGAEPRPVKSVPDDISESDLADIEDLERMKSEEFEEKAQAFKMTALATETSLQTGGDGRNLLVNDILAGDQKATDKKGHVKKKGVFLGVFIPTCENMWGVLIFLRFHTIVGNAGLFQALCVVLLSFACAFCTTSSMSATVSSGGLVSKGGPYYMISRALGPCVGASVGVMYWLAITMLAVLEVLGAVEGIMMAAGSDAEFAGYNQAYGSVLMAVLAIFVFLGMNFVSKLGFFFFGIVLATLFMYYYGILTAPSTDMTGEYSGWITGVSSTTLGENWGPHYAEGNNFGVMLSIFFPCFTGILSGANRMDVLKNPQKNLKHGTFGAIIFSLVMYSSFMILWASVANYQYLRGDEYHADDDHHHRRLAGGGGTSNRVVEEISWNPFKHAAALGIIISSLSQALQCLVVSPKLLQAIAKDEILAVLKPLAPLSHKGEPARALAASYLVAAALVLIGSLDIVAPLLSMCFLVAYAFMNFSCLTLTLLKSTAWRPTGIHHKRYRLWYIGTSGLGFIICIVIMFTINPFWAIAALILALCLYMYINFKVEEKGWGSAVDGLRYQLALSAMIGLEKGMSHHVNWRPQVLVLYRIKVTEELKGIHHHEILRFYSMLRKGKGFCVVACVLEAAHSERALHKAAIEKDIIQTIMRQNSISGFAEVVVAPTWVEGTNYVIQLSGIGGLVPNTVLLEWPRTHKDKNAREFCSVLSTALAANKAVLAVKGVRDFPTETVFGTIDIWWMIHDGGFMILLSWLMSHHRIWSKCHMRVFTISEDVTHENAQIAATRLTETLRQRRLFDVDVEVVILETGMAEPFAREDSLRKGPSSGKMSPKSMDVERIPQKAKDLFEEALSAPSSKRISKPGAGHHGDGEEEPTGDVRVSDTRGTLVKPRKGSRAPTATQDDAVINQLGQSAGKQHNEEASSVAITGAQDKSDVAGRNWTSAAQPDEHVDGPAEQGLDSHRLSVRNAFVRDDAEADGDDGASIDGTLASFEMLNELISTRSKRAQLVVMNLPESRGTADDAARHYMHSCDVLTKGLDRVLFVHSTGHEIFDITI